VASGGPNCLTCDNPGPAAQGAWARRGRPRAARSAGGRGRAAGPLGLGYEPAPAAAGGARYDRRVGYRLLGFAVWRAARWYVSRRARRARVPIALAAVGAAAAAGLAAAARRGGARSA